ncbi:MAG: hypothetical protein J6U02_00520 [Elusimicrobia bacterium]|nr:hypothetical protein [Elusimicrobiota bacterium]
MAINIDVSNLVGMTLDNTTFSDVTPHLSYTGYFTLDSGLVISEPPYLIFDYGASQIRIDSVLQQDGRYKIEYSEETYITPNTITAYGVALDRSNLMSQYRFIRAYKADENIITQVANARFYAGTGGVSEDLGKYILSYIHYPFDVDTDGSNNIELGFFDTQILCDLVKEQYHTFTLFDDVVNGLYENDSDIENAEIIVFLPFVGKYTLESKYINTKITIKYICDILSNDCIIYIYSNDKIIDNIKTTLGYEEPFITKESSIDFSFVNQMNSNANKNKQGVITVYQKANTTNRYNNHIIKKVETLTGFIKGTFEEFTGNSEILLKEINRIKTLFNSGVINIPTI